MKEYDVFIAGGGIAGSVAAKFAAKKGLKTIFIEKYKAPRMKSCSGIQLPYLEKIIGEKIPSEKLCTNKLTKVSIIRPDGKKFNSPFKMLNFTRDIFDNWLNQVAIKYGAEFRDECVLFDWKINPNNIIVSISDRDKNIEKIKTKYLIDATGLMPIVRMKMRPEDFEKRSTGATVNYYFNGEGDLDPNRLYQYWNLDYNNMMFAWIYKKNDLWVIGTGYDKNISKVGQDFFQFVKREYNLKGEVVKKEGFSSTMNMGESRVHLGEGCILFIGDAAGLVDMYRGLGMDAAALSGRLAAKAIIEVEKKGKQRELVYEIYSKKMRRIVKQTNKNIGKGIYYLKNNDDLLNYMKKFLIKGGMAMILQKFLNKFRSPVKVRLLPP
ncbi:MAG: NAD(P)/FAD-dependent oxidoreductase [Candidatus Hodarchaeota archaeon]